MAFVWTGTQLSQHFLPITIGIRKDNPSGLKKLFKVFVSLLKDADLIAGETIAIDGTKSRAHNSKKANFNQKKIDKHQAYIEEKSQEYIDELARNDASENS